jgi:threonyl-tRNA synthetase
MESIRNSSSNSNTNPVPKTHQELGQSMELFMMNDNSVGSAFMLENGSKIYIALVDYFRQEYKKRGYKEVITPVMASHKLFQQSGHLEHYEENMYGITACCNLEGGVLCEEIDGSKPKFEYYLSPTNCPKHCLIYAHKLRSYRELPIRYADFGCLHRNEASGSLRGLNRLRKFSQDDAHVFCTTDQIQSEITDCMNFLRDTYTLFGFDYKISLSTRPDKFMGNIEIWMEAEEKLRLALESLGMPYTVNEKDGAFYGPKIDVIVKDSLGREVQCGTIQLDFQLPHRFNLEYKDWDGQMMRPVLIHRAICGSIERCMGILIEHYQGKFPVWMSFRQIAIVPVSHKPEFIEYCDVVKSLLQKTDPRLDSITVFDSHETFNSKLRNSITDMYNYVLIVGKKEIESNTVTFKMKNHVETDERFVDLLKVCEIIKSQHHVLPTKINK